MEGVGIPLWVLPWWSTFPFIHIIGRNVICSYIMMILLTFIIMCRLKMWYLLWSTIIIGVTGCFTITPIPLWIILTTSVWIMLYKYSQKIKQSNCEMQIKRIIYISFRILPILSREKNVSTNWWIILFNAVLLPTIWISSSSTGDIWPGWLLLF